MTDAVTVTDKPMRLETHTIRVSLRIKGAPEHRTRKGRAPMVPSAVHLTYSLPRAEGGGGHAIEIELIGEAARPLRDYERPGDLRRKRRLVGADLPDQPPWLLRLIEEHRPATWLGEVPKRDQ